MAARLQDEFLVVDDTQQLVPPPAEQPPPRPVSPALPPGVLSVDQLCSAVAAMQSAQHPAGFLAVQTAVELMLGLASQGGCRLRPRHMEHEQSTCRHCCLQMASGAAASTSCIGKCT